jgi:hypothetical protein
LTLLSVKVDSRLKERMKKFPQINWSEVMRKAVEDRLQMEEALARERKIDRNLVKASMEVQDIIREKSQGVWSATREIRKWRAAREAGQ